MNDNLSAPEPAPVSNNKPAVWDMVIADMIDRDFTGQQKYGTRLQPFNGRNSLVDAYQEVLDLAVYMRQMIYEMEEITAENICLTAALRNLLLHTTMIGIAEGFPIEVQYDENDHDTPQAFNINAAGPP